MRCPSCRKDTVVALNDPKVNPTAIRRCITCGQEWSPLIIPPAQFRAWNEERLGRDKRDQKWWDDYTERMAREIVDKGRRGLPVNTEVETQT